MHGAMIVAFVLGVVASILAYNKGRNSLGWFIAGLLVGPFALLVATLPPIAREGHFKQCPFCAEIIKERARWCRHCGLELEKVR